MIRQTRVLLVAPLLVGVVGVGAACAGSSAPPAEGTPRATIAQAPGWYENPQAYGDSAHLVSVATAVSQQMQLAVDKAKTAARAELAEQLGTRYEVLRKRFQEEVGSGPDSELVDRYNSITRSVTNQVLQGTRARKQDIHPADSTSYRAYVLMELPLQRADRQLLDRIMSDKEMYVRFRATRALKDLKRSASGQGRLLQNRP